MELVRFGNFQLGTTNHTLQNQSEGRYYQKWEYDEFVSIPKTEVHCGVF